MRRVSSPFEQDRTDAGVDPLSNLLQAKLTAAQLKLTRMHLETRSATLAKQLSILTGLPVGSIVPDHGSIPDIPIVSADEVPQPLLGVQSSNALARSKLLEAKGADLAWRRPSIGFVAVYNYDSNELNSYSTYYKNFTPNNVSFGLQISLPFFDFAVRAKAKVSAAEALRAKVEAEQAQQQNDIQINQLTASLRELDAEAASRRASSSRSLRGAVEERPCPTGSGKWDHRHSRRDSRSFHPRRSNKPASMEARSTSMPWIQASTLSKARLNLLRALGHMQDWLDEPYINSYVKELGSGTPETTPPQANLATIHISQYHS